MNEHMNYQIKKRKEYMQEAHRMMLYFNFNLVIYSPDIYEVFLKIQTM